MKKLSIIILSLGLAVGAKAQSELTLPFMNNVFQSSYINPTVLPEHTFSLGLPGLSSVYGSAITNGFLLNNIVSVKNDTAHFSPMNFMAELKDKNLLYAGASVDIFHIRMKVRNGYYWFGVRNNLTVDFQYPKSLFALAIEGNANYLGSSLDLSNLKIDVSEYNEYTFGMAKEYNRWVFGGRVSLLQGLVNAQFNPKALNLQIDTTNYNYIMNADISLNTAGIPKNSAGDPSFDHVSEVTYITDFLTNFKNKGYSLSLGATYKLSDKIKFSVAFSDLGFINWKDSVTNYTLKGKSDFSGVNIIQSYLNGTDIKPDSILNAMVDKYTRDTVQISYKTYLHPKFYASASYDIFRRTNIGFAASGVYNKKLYPAFTLGLSQGLGRFFNLLATFSYNQRSTKNLGLGLVIKPGPFQIYVIADNVYPAINPLYTTNVNVRVGMNFVFGRVKPSIGLPYR